MADFPDGWLRDQITKSSATLDGLDPAIREALAYRTHAQRAEKQRAEQEEQA